MVWAVSLSTTDLITRSPTAALEVPAFGVWLGLVACKALSPSSALPPGLNMRR
jgi:hypothetical protein